MYFLQNIHTLHEPGSTQNSSPGVAAPADRPLCTLPFIEAVQRLRTQELPVIQTKRFKLQHLSSLQPLQFLTKIFMQKEEFD